MIRRPHAVLGPALALCLAAVAACGSGEGGAGPGPTGGGSAPATSGGQTASCTATEPADTTALAPTSTFDTIPPTAAPTTVAPTTPATAMGSTAAHGTATTGTPPTSVPAAPAVALYRGPTTRDVVALTFDAGSDCGYAARILDTLAAEGIKATFGMTGRWAEANPDVVRRMADEGHLLLNHTYDHRSFTGFSTGTAPLSAAERHDELTRADQAVGAITGRSMAPWFRPPYGDVDATVNADLGTDGYRWNVLWTVDSLGWKGLSADEIETRCLDRAGAGVIYLFHVGSQSQDAAALPALIAGLRDRGYGFVRVDEMV